MEANLKSIGILIKFSGAAVLALTLSALFAGLIPVYLYLLFGAAVAVVAASLNYRDFRDACTTAMKEQNIKNPNITFVYYLPVLVIDAAFWGYTITACFLESLVATLTSKSNKKPVDRNSGDE